MLCILLSFVSGFLGGKDTLWTVTAKPKQNKTKLFHIFWMTASYLCILKGEMLYKNKHITLIIDFYAGYLIILILHINSLMLY